MSKHSTRVFASNGPHLGSQISMIYHKPSFGIHIRSVSSDCVTIRRSAGLVSVVGGGTFPSTGLGPHLSISGHHHDGGICRASVIQRSIHSSGDDGYQLDMEHVWKNMKQVVKFAVPVLMVPIADPLMSLIDTIFLGQYSGSLHVASLSPCTLLFNFAFYSFTALTIATVSIVADYLRQDKDEEAGKVLSTSLILGCVGGCLVACVLKMHAPALLVMTGCDPQLLDLAGLYLGIRAWAFPAAILTSVLQGSFIAQRDSKTPFMIVLTSIILSAFGDYVLMRVYNAGIAAAAWTTLISQYVSATLLLFRACTRSRVVPRLVLPTVGEIAQLVRYVGTLGVFYVAKTSSYLLLQASAAKMAATALAAHQGCWALWGLCSFTSAPLEQASLAFLPTAKAGREKNELTAALILTGGCLGVVCSIIAVGIPTMFPWILTADATLWPIMKSIWVQGLVSMLCCGFDVTSTGILLANRDTVYVARAMTLSLGLLGLFLVSVQWYWQGFTICQVWWGLAIFFFSRIVQSFPRVLKKHMTV